LEAWEARETPGVFTVNTLVDESDGLGVGDVSWRAATAEATARLGAEQSQGVDSGQLHRLFLDGHLAQRLVRALHRGGGSRGPLLELLGRGHGGLH
jgi:hypothetical protein